LEAQNLQKKQVFGGTGTVAGTGRQTLACAMGKSWYRAP